MLSGFNSTPKAEAESDTLRVLRGAKANLDGAGTIHYAIINNLNDLNKLSAAIEAAINNG